MTTPTSAALSSAYRHVSAPVDSLPDTDFHRPTGCADWTVQELLFHLLLDAQRALMVLAAPAYDVEPDTDAATYWSSRPWTQPAAEVGAPTRFVRRAAAAYERPRGLVHHWRDTAAAAEQAAQRADPGARVRTQGCCLGAGELIDTLVVEATLHALDLVHSLPHQPPPPRAATEVTARTLARLLGRPLPDWWATEEGLLKSPDACRSWRPTGSASVTTRSLGCP